MNSISSFEDLGRILQTFKSVSTSHKDLKLSDLGLTHSGQAVRLVDHPGDKQLLESTFDLVLKAIAPKVFADRSTTTIEDACRLISFRHNRKPKAGKPAKSVAQQPAQHNEHDRIRKLLDRQKHNYQEEYEHLEKMTTTRAIEWKGQTIYWTSTPENKQEQYGYCSFLNTYLPETWILSENFKSQKVDRKCFFMGNVVAMQYEQCFTEKGWSLQLPKAIHLSNIWDISCYQLISSYPGNYNSREFIELFMNNTDYGKSFRHFVSDFELEADWLELREGDILRDESFLADDPSVPERLLTVVVYVRAKPSNRVCTNATGEVVAPGGESRCRAGKGYEEAQDIVGFVMYQ